MGQESLHQPVDILLSKHATKLAQLSKTIQLSSDTINGLVESVESRLKQLNLGVEAEVQLTPDWGYGYGKVRGHNWCLYKVVRSFQDAVPVFERSPIKNESRHEKVRCLLTIPKILDALVENSGKLLQELDNANSQVSVFLEVLQQHQ
jgi:hypothetical protein